MLQVLFYFGGNMGRKRQEKLYKGNKIWVALTMNR